MDRVIAGELLDRFEQGENGLATWLRYLLDRAKPLDFRESLAREIRHRRYPIADPAPWTAAHWGLVDPREAHPRAFTLAERSLAHLEQVPVERRSFALRHLRHQILNPALLDVFAAEARTRLVAPGEALGWLDLARIVLVRLQAASFPALLLAPYRLRLAAYRANTHRVMGSLPASERIFEGMAAESWPNHLPRIEQEAEILSLEASLRVDQRDFARVEVLHSRLECLCREIRDDTGLAKILMQRGRAAHSCGDTGRALSAARQAEALLARSCEAAHYSGCLQNQASFLVSLGRLDEASLLLVKARDLYERVDTPHPIARLKFCWIEARLAEAAGRLAEAQQRLAEVQHGMAASGRGLDAVLAKVQAAGVSLKQGAWSAAASQAESVLPFLELQGLQEEALKAARLFQQALAAQA